MASGLKFNASRSDDRTVKNGASATSMALDYGGSKDLKFSASMGNSDNGTKQTSTSRLNLEATPTDTVKLVASRSADDNDKGDVSNTKVNLDVKASDAVQLALTHTGDDNGKINKEASGLNVVAKPSDAIRLTMAAGVKDEGNGAGQTKAVGVEANPNGGLSLGFSHSDSTDNSGLTGANKVTLAAGGKDNKVTTSYTDALTPTGASSIKEASVSLVPSKNKLTVGGSFRDEIKQDRSEVQIAMLQADVKPADIIAVSGYYKQRDTGAADQINTMNASVTLKPAAGLQMVGTYSANPEEKDQVLRLVRRGLSLQTQMGGLKLSGGYLQENSLVDASEGTRAQFTLSLRCSKYSNLEGGFEQTVGAVRGYAQKMAYNVKYDHKIGSDFNLSLDANVSENPTAATAAERNNVKATANLGLRF